MRILSKAFILTLGIPSGLALSQAEYKGSRFADTWSTVLEGPYQTLPQEKVTARSFFSGTVNKLFQASERTLATGDDTLPYFQKLLHPNGVCMAGTWNITEPSHYTGYFKQGSQGLIIARASAALSQVNRGEKRSFGFAGKIYPTTDPGHQELLKTANFFAIDNLAGTYTENYLDSPMTNDITNVALGVENLTQLGILGVAGSTFAVAEKTLAKILTVRQLYQIAELGEENPEAAITPLWLKVVGRPGVRTVNQDFRDDVRTAVQAGTLYFDIYVTSKGILGFDKGWEKIGYIAIDQESASEGCDHRLHFQHPGWRNDLRTE